MATLTFPVSDALKIAIKDAAYHARQSQAAYVRQAIEDRITADMATEQTLVENHDKAKTGKLSLRSIADQLPEPAERDEHAEATDWDNTNN